METRLVIKRDLDAATLKLPEQGWSLVDPWIQKWTHPRFPTMASIREQLPGIPLEGLSGNPPRFNSETAVTVESILKTQEIVRTLVAAGYERIEKEPSPVSFLEALREMELKLLGAQWRAPGGMMVSTGRLFRVLKGLGGIAP